jgi:hypothetical protein
MEFDMDEEVQIMLDRATQVVDAIAEDSWAPESAILMPTYCARLTAEQEAARVAIEEANERERAAEAERRKTFRQQQDTAKIERERKARVRRQERKAHKKESKLLSPE